MTAPRIFAALLPAALLLAVLSVAALACAAPPPLPTYTPYPTQSPLPTLTPFPTWTPAPTATAYPTATPYPSPTPYPTATAYPTPTPLPTRTPAPTWTPLPTHTPYPTWTPAPTSAWPDWQTYRHNADRDGGAECDDRPNFEVELPPLWTNDIASCDFAWFSSPDATLSISILERPGYSASPLVAMGQLFDALHSQYSYQHTQSGQTVYVTIHNAATIVHREEPAIYQTLTERLPASSQYCDETGYRLITLSRSWRSHSQKAIMVTLLRCESAQVNETDLMRMLYSFRLIAPY